MVKIYLVKHGAALSPDIDPERPLSPEGKTQVEKVAKFLAHHSFPLSAILHSHKARAKETAEILGRYLDPDLKLEQSSHLAPNDPIQPILDRIEDGVMLVSHFPLLQKLSGYLIAHDEMATVVKLSDSMVICLERLDGRFAIDWALDASLVR